jgi:phosphoribosyl-ATP pyrophosphohydrolase
MYQENIYGIIEGTGEKVSTLIIPKNSGLKGYAWKVLKQAGLDLDEAVEVAENTSRIGELTLIQKRGEDIPQLVVDYAVKRGEVVLGVTGDDLYDEFRLRFPDNPLKVENTYDWFDEKAKYLRPALCFINKTGNAEDVPLEARVAINTKYEVTSRDFLVKSPLVQERNFDVAVYNGDVEITVAEGTADCAIDAVYSGKTLDKRDLRVIDRVRFSDLVVLSPLKQDASLFDRAMTKEYAQVLDRLQRPTDSYTSRLLADPEKLARKSNEEMLELILAVLGVGDGKVIPEAADVMYTVNMLLAKANVSLDDVAREMSKRQK